MKTPLKLFPVISCVETETLVLIGQEPLLGYVGCVKLVPPRQPDPSFSCPWGLRRVLSQSGCVLFSLLLSPIPLRMSCWLGTTLTQEELVHEGGEKRNDSIHPHRGLCKASHTDVGQFYLE